MALFATLRGAALTSLTLGEAVRFRSENISNAENENYHRQEIFFSTSNLNRPRIAQVRRVTEQGLERRFAQQISESAYRSTLQRYADELKLAAGLGTAQAVQGESSPQPLLDTAFRRFESALKDWQASPESGVAYNAVLQSGENIATTISGIAQELQQLRLRLDETIRQEVAETNRLLERFAELNGRVVATANIGNDANALNQREEVLRQIAQRLSLQVLENRNGAQSLHLQNGQAVVIDSIVNTLSYSFDANQRQITLSSSIAAVSQDQVDSRNSLGGGSLSALFNLVRQGASSTADAQEEVALIAKYERQLDYLAQNLFNNDSNSFNAVYRDAAADDSSAQILQTQIFVQDTAISGGDRFALQFEPTLLTSATRLSPLSVQNLDDSENILSALAAASRSIPPAGNTENDLPPTLRQENSNYYALVQGISVRLNSLVVSYEDKATAQQTIRDEFQTLLSNFAGVNIDEELLKINQLQQTYTANARVIQSVNAMLESLFQAV